jgi:hypothetical protein
MKRSRPLARRRQADTKAISREDIKHFAPTPTKNSKKPQHLYTATPNYPSTYPPKQKCDHYATQTHTNESPHDENLDTPASDRAYPPKSPQGEH